MSRWRAAAIHLCISVAVATFLIVAMLLLWYPPPYFLLMGGTMLVVLIAGCDVVLGPLLTLIVFKTGKKSLPFDLATIAFLQAVALTYGLYTMFAARPVYTVFAADRFEVTAANEIPVGELSRASPEFSSLPLAGPRLVGALLPANSDERLAIAMRSMVGGPDIKAMPRLYVPYQSVKPIVISRLRSLDDLEKKNPATRATLLAKLHDAALVDRAGYLPLVGRFRSMVAVVDRQSGDIDTIVDLDPW